MDEDAKEFARIQTDFQVVLTICLALLALTAGFFVAFAELHLDILLVLTLIMGLLTIITAILAIMERRKMNKPSILGAPKKRTEPYLRITPKLEKYSPITFKNNLRGLNVWIENVGYSNAKSIEVRCQLVPDASIPLKNKGVFRHPLLTPKEPVKYQAVKDFESHKLLSQQLIIETSYSNEEDEKQKPMKTEYLVKELEEELEETKTS